MKDLFLKDDGENNLNIINNKNKIFVSVRKHIQKNKINTEEQDDDDYSDDDNDMNVEDNNETDEKKNNNND